jgi:hypothetical protein
MKIKKKTMNKIHNEMVRRFSPYWDRKNVQMEELRADMASIMLQIEELKQLAEPKAVEEEPKSAGRHTANPEIPLTQELPEVWEARFYILGNKAVSTINTRSVGTLKRIGIEHVANFVPDRVGVARVYLLPTLFPGKVDTLREQLSRIMGAPVKIIWRKVQ